MSEINVDHETSANSENAGRRRLVRGVVALAPLVLTLRSGAVAAASCTGATAIGTLSQESGNRFRFNRSSGSTPVAGSVCVTDPVQCPQADGNAPSLTSGGAKNGTLREQPGTNGYLYCDGTGYRANQPVAILSATAAGSLFPT